MPNIITHTLFADDVQDLLDNESLKSRRKLFAAGSNGPDFLFFHNISPATSGSPLRCAEWAPSCTADTSLSFTGIC